MTIQRFRRGDTFQRGTSRPCRIQSGFRYSKPRTAVCRFQAIRTADQKADTPEPHRWPQGPQQN